MVSDNVRLHSADLNCVCTNTNFQKAANACITATCGAKDLAAALQLQKLECSLRKQLLPISCISSADLCLVIVVSKLVAGKDL